MPPAAASAVLTAPTSPHRGLWLLGVGDAARMELFLRNARGWRSSIGGMAVMTLLVAWAFHHAAPEAALWTWASLGWLAYGLHALLLLRWERRPAEQAPSGRWLAGNGLISLWVGLLWNSLPWWLPGEQASLQLLAALGGGMVLLGAANASTSAGILAAVVLPGALLVPSALYWHAGLPLAAVVALLLVGAIFVHGLGVQKTMLQAIEQRRSVERLSQRLREQQAQLEAAEREQALQAERQRVLSDLHDGVGGALILALRRIEQRRLGLDDVAAVLRECIDDLRLVIDSLEPIGHDLTTLLATLRYRLGPRIEDAGIAIEWTVEDLPPQAWLRPPQALEVLRILQEALANVLKHAGADTLRIALGRDPDSAPGRWALLRIEDDGRGFDAAAAGAGRGLAHMQRRARRLGGRLALESTPGRGTRLCLWLPLDGD